MWALTANPKGARASCVRAFIQTLLIRCDTSLPPPQVSVRRELLPVGLKLDGSSSAAEARPSLAHAPPPLSPADLTAGFSVLVASSLSVRAAQVAAVLTADSGSAKGDVPGVINSQTGTIEFKLLGSSSREAGEGA